MLDPVFHKTVRLALAMLGALALAALLQTTLRAKTPAALEVGAATPAIAGFTSRLISSTPASNGDHQAWGTSYQWNLLPQDPAIQSFRMQLTPVHSREWMELSLEAMSGKNSAAIDIAERNQYQIEIDHQRIDTVDIGRSGHDTVLQTCLVPGGRADVTMTGLNAAVTEQVEMGMRRRIMHLLGLRPNVRWECVLINIRQQGNAVDPEVMLQLWRSSRPAIEGLLQAAKAE